MSVAEYEGTAIAASPKKSNHRANIVRIATILPHNNADKLELIKIDGYQVVSQKGQFKPGDLAVYIQPDSIVPQEKPFHFIWGPYVDFTKIGDLMADPAGFSYPVPERRRRITVRKFRGEWSEGLLMPVSDFPELSIINDHGGSRQFLPQEGEDVSDLLGITHYDPDAGVESTKGDTTNAPRRKYPKSLRGWFFFLLHKLTGKRTKALNQAVSFSIPTYDVEALKNHVNAFEPGETVRVTEKIHGSNARFIFLDGVMYAGSRTQWKSVESDCVWRKALLQNPWIQKFCELYEGFALYGEVTPTQKGFTYGNKDGSVRFFVFDILTPEGKWLPVNTGAWNWFTPDEMVPVLYDGPFNKEVILKLVDGASLVDGANHIREGIVVKTAEERSIRGLGRLQLKIVSNAFLDKDSK